MGLSEFERKRVEKIFAAYCEKRVPHHVQDRFRLEFEIRGDEVKLFEARPHWEENNAWVSSKVARFRKDPQSNCWQLYFADRNGRWHLFEPCPASSDIEKLLDEVEKNSTGAFWG